MPHRRAHVPPPPPEPPRQGPRPLPLHLMAHASTLMGSRVALTLWKNGSLPWNPGLAQKAADLKARLDAAGPDAWDRLDAALAAETLSRHREVLDGVRAYQGHPHQRAMPAVPSLWSEGTTRLLDYRDPARPGGVPVLVVPSLINRAYILDLTARRSLLRALARQGLAPFLVDWDAPGEVERAFTMTDYVDGRLAAALDQVVAVTGQKPALLGYCMGGNLALALALAHPDRVRGLALLATPWDFHAGGDGHAALLRSLAPVLDGLIHLAGCLPVDMLQALFSTLDPGLMARKFAAFSHLDGRSAKARDFVAIEDWANDGVPLAGPVARECLQQWYGDNDTALGRWRVGGRGVDPAALSMPVIGVVPGRDRIVPPASALALLNRIAGARVLTVPGGHVGMLLAPRAGTELYRPLGRWLGRLPVTARLRKGA